MIVRTLTLAFSLIAPMLAQAPLPESAPLPTLESVLQALEAKQAEARPLMDAYSYTERETMHVRDAKGKLVQEEVKEYEVTPVHGRSIKRLVKVDGKPLPEKEARKEDARVLQEAVQAEEDTQGGLGKVGLRKLMKFWEVTGLRRVVYQEVPALVIDFRPKAKVETKGKAEEAASKLAGSLYLEERSLEALHLDARLVAPMRLGWFLASVAEGATVSQDFQRVNGEITLPAQMTGHFAARILFGHVQVEISSQCTDFKKFDIGASKVTEAQMLRKAQ